MSSETDDSNTLHIQIEENHDNRKHQARGVRRVQEKRSVLLQDWLTGNYIYPKDKQNPKSPCVCEARRVNALIADKWSCPVHGTVRR